MEIPPPLATHVQTFGKYPIYPREVDLTKEGKKMVSKVGMAWVILEEAVRMEG